MRNIVILIVCVLFFVACEQKTDLVIYNNTGFYLDYTLDGVLQQRIEAGSPPARHSYSLGRKYTFYNPTKDLRVRIWGPVYQRGIIGHGGNYIANPQEERTITLRHDEDYRIRIRPNRVKLSIYNCATHDHIISSVRMERNSDPRNLLQDGKLIHPGESDYVRIDRNVNDAVPPNVLFVYTFEIITTTETRRRITMSDEIHDLGGEFQLHFCLCVVPE